jgi:hypothetical protein
MLGMAASAGPLDVDQASRQLSSANCKVSQCEDRAGNVGHYPLWKREYDLIVGVYCCCGDWLGTLDLIRGAPTVLNSYSN